MFSHFYHLQKNNAQLITWSFLTIQSVSLTSAAFEAFAEAYLWFLVSASPKKTIAGAIKFLGILKTHVSKKNIYFCLKKKSNVLLNKKVIFVLHTVFRLDFITQIIYFSVHRCLHSLFILFCSVISVSKKRDMKIMLPLPYSYKWQKLNTKMNEKVVRGIKVWILNMELGKLIVAFSSFFWADFVIWFLDRIENLKML